VDFYSGAYPDLLPKREAIREVFHKEQDAFVKTYEGGIKEFRKILEKGDPVLPGADLFALTATYGFPFELTEELALRAGRTVDHKGFLAEMEHHRELSRAGQEKKFGGHGLILDTGELKAGSEAELRTVTRLHTATHMLQRALREVLGPDVGQAGSDITAERTRFDFTFPRKLTPEEIQKVEDLVNEKIREDLPMQKMVLPKEAAVKTGALFFFKEKYPDPVNVYFIGHDLDSAWSKEFCGGPHVTHTGEIGAFRIVKEEAVSSGVRRIRGVVQ
jgi:alanyl-tRNA synthetase